MAGRREDLVSSFRLAVTEEARLFGAGLLALVVYGLWVGLSGAALTFAADALEVGLSPQPWTDAKTALAAVAVLAWVLVPAAVAAWLLVGQLTNESGNIAQRYRYRHPGVLLAPPAALLAVALVATVALAGPPWPVFIVLVFAALFLLARTIAYGYRVFSLSAPRVLAAATGLSGLALAVALLTGGATVAGREDYLGAVTEGFTGAVGADAAAWIVSGSVTVAGVTLPAAVAAAVGVPAGLSVFYLMVQTLAGVVNRVREPDVPRSELRTGQRYPDLARPTTSRAGGAGGSGTSGASSSPRASESSTAPTPAGAGSGSGSGSAASSTTGSTSSASPSGSRSSPPDQSPDPATPGETKGGGAGSGSDDSPTVDTGPADPQVTDDVSNTRVYTPPDDGGDEGEDPLSSGTDLGDESDGADTDVETGDSTGPSPTGSTATADDVCPECGGSHDPGAVFCPACGAALE
jgi:hypothetical protein